MRDVVFPVRGPGYVDIEGAAPLLVDQASLWIAGYVDALRGVRAPPRARRDRGPDLAPLRPFLCRLRPRRRPHGRTPAPRRHRPGPGTGHARRRASHPRRVGRVALLDRPGLGPPGPSHDHRAALRYPRWRGEGLPVPGEPGAGAARPQVAPGAAALRRPRLHPHPGRDRPPPLPALPGDPAPAFLAARESRHGLYRGPLRSPWWRP